MGRHVDLDDTDQVRDYIASKDCSIGYKENLADCYDRYVKHNGLSWNKPRYRRVDPIVKLPSEERVDRIIASCNLKNALAFTLIKETGIRPIELHRLSHKDLDLENGVIYIRSAKHGKSRSAKLKTNTLAMLKTFTTKFRSEVCGKTPLFSGPMTLSKAFQRARNRVAKRFHDPPTKHIRLYDLRHYYGSMLYHQTKDLFYVKEMMGHRSISSTLRYVHLVHFERDDYTVRVTKNLEEASKLLESGFEYVTDWGDSKVFRKRK